MEQKKDAGGGGRRAVFLDRDGTINREVHFLKSPEQLELVEGSARGLAMLQSAGFLLVVISNQSGVARGYFSEEDVHSVNDRLSAILREDEEDLDLVHYYYCPHLPETGEPRYRVECDCRKPSPGLFLKAAAELGIDIEASYAVGDSERDLRPARELGARTALVLTGHARPQDLELWDFRPDGIFPNLFGACLWILEDSADGGE